jgi:hypothetical protein
MRVAAFDMGTRNFAFCVEEIEPRSTINPPKPRFDEQGLAVDAYKTYLEDSVYHRGRLIEMQCIDLKAESEALGQTTNIYLTLTLVLNRYTRLWDAVDVFLVEQQMAYGNNKSNIQALRLAQHTLSYFWTIYGGFRTIQEFSSTHKTRLLGCPRTQRRAHKLRKAFSVELCTQLLEKRKDPLQERHTGFPKRDDVSDCVLMIQAYKVLSGL